MTDSNDEDFEIQGNKIRFREFDQEKLNNLAPHLKLSKKVLKERYSTEEPEPAHFCVLIYTAQRDALNVSCSKMTIYSIQKNLKSKRSITISQSSVLTSEWSASVLVNVYIKYH